MCGIAGIARFDGGSVSEATLRAMTNRMVRRGPDDEGFVSVHSVGLGMRRLSIIDVNGGHQPLTNESRDIHLVLNGEIYNHIELRRRLESQGHSFRTHSDAEVVLHLYEEEGVEALHLLNGMFAFALYDERRRALWIARDRLGIKPLFYAQDESGVTFASDINALRAGNKANVDATAVLGYLALGYAPGDGTVWQGVKKLPPAHHLWVADGRLTVKRYWEVQEFGDYLGDVSRAVDELDALLVDAVRLQLRSDVPLGVLLSGGLDSSAVTAIAAGLIEEPLQTFTARFDGKGESADADFSRQVASRYATSHSEIGLTAIDAAAALDELLPLMDEPISDSAIIPSYCISKAARARNIKVLLSGAGGDEIFCGYGRHRPAPVGRPRWFADVLPPAMRSALGQAWAVVQPRHGLRVRHPAYAWAATVNGINLDTAQALLRSRPQFEHLLAVMRQEFHGLDTTDSGLGFVHARMHVDLETYLPDNVLSLTDKATMAASVEGRVPLLDHRVVELAFRLPERMNELDGRAKGLLKRAMSARLPSDLIYRRKEGFNAPIAAWLQDDCGFDVALELRDHRTPLLEELFSAPALEKLLAAPERRRHSEHLLFSVFLLNRWHRAHLDT